MNESVSQGELAKGGQLTKMYKAAKKYTEQGFKVIPIHYVKNGTCSCRKGLNCPSKGKHPATPNGVKDASSNPDDFRQFWQYQYNIGIACGKASGIWVLDVDPRNGGKESLKKILSVAGIQESEIKTLKEKTGGGGTHYFFLLPDNFQLPKKTPALPGIDFLGDGLLCVVSPSIHASGGDYEFYE